MKETKFLYTILCLIIFCTISSCSDDDNERKGPSKGQSNDNYVDEWIYKNMSDIYLWNNYIPEEKKLNFEASPNTFFNSLLHDDDHFSRMEDTHVNLPRLAAATKSSSNGGLGFDYCLINILDKNGNYQYSANLVWYVKKESDAAAKGLRRGCLIREVDGITISKSNWYEVLNKNKTSYKIKFAKNENDLTQNIYVQNTISSSNIEDSPIFLDSIYTVNTHKIGYLVYNAFKMGDLSTRKYDVELASILTKFKNEGVNEMILDLRYNGGGYINCAQYLASALVAKRNTNNIFEIKTYNRSIQAKLDRLPDNDSYKINMMYEYFEDNITNNNNKNLASIPRLGDQINNIYVIGTRFTASASELIINALKPYMEENGKHLYLVGETTRGKNVGSWPIYEDGNKNNTYVLWPIIFRSHNKTYTPSNPDLSSDYSKGFEADIPGDDIEMLTNGLKDLGDRDETLLKVAMNHIQSIDTPKIMNRINKGVTIGPSSTEMKNGGFIMIGERPTEQINRE